MLAYADETGEALTSELRPGGHRFQAILTDQTGDIAELERDRRGRARVEDHIRNDTSA